MSKYIFFTDEVQISSKGNISVKPCPSQLETFSPYIADLLVRCCVQIEAISKELYFDNGGIKSRGDTNLYFDEDCLKLIDMKWQTHSKIVMVVAPFFNLTKDENYILKPLNRAHKRQGTYWERAYQAVKHDRFLSLQKGNVKAFLQALAALYLLNLYYRNDSWVTKYQDISKLDYSLGSSIFTVKPPIAEQLWDGNKPITSESPYVVNYKDTAYQRNDPKQRVMHIWELAKYRLNKKIPNNLPFQERKRLLVNSPEWNGWIHKNNNHLTEEELTEENIQQEIDTVGILWGMEIMKKYQKLEWLPIALNSEICKIYIP